MQKHALFFFFEKNLNDSLIGNVRALLSLLYSGRVHPEDFNFVVAAIWFYQTWNKFRVARELNRGDKVGEREICIDARGRKLRDLFEIFVIMSRRAQCERNGKKNKSREVFRDIFSLSLSLILPHFVSSSLSLIFFYIEINPDSCRIHNAKKLDTISLRLFADVRPASRKTLDKVVNAILQRTRKISDFAYFGNPYQLNRIVHCIGFCGAVSWIQNMVVRLVFSSLDFCGSYPESGATGTGKAMGRDGTGMGGEERDGQIKVHFYSSHIGHAGRGLIYGKILRHSRGFRIPNADAGTSGKREIMVDVAINKWSRIHLRSMSAGQIFMGARLLYRINRRNKGTV